MSTPRLWVTALGFVKCVYLDECKDLNYLLSVTPLADSRGSSPLQTVNIHRTLCFCIGYTFNIHHRMAKKAKGWGPIENGVCSLQTISYIILRLNWFYLIWKKCRPQCWNSSCTRSYSMCVSLSIYQGIWDMAIIFFIEISFNFSNLFRTHIWYHYLVKLIILYSVFPFPVKLGLEVSNLESVLI